MKFDYFLGIDPGLIHDPTGLVLIRAQRPAVVVREGKIVSAETGQEIPLPKGVTVGEYVAPRYSVTSVDSIKGMTFDQAGREARAIMADLSGGSGFLAVVDATGLGRGCVDQVRKSGVPAIACTLTSGSRVTGGRWEVNVPVGLMFTNLYSIMAQGRLQVTDPARERLVEEMKEVERRVSDAGRETFEISRADGHHADCVYAAAMALLIAERRVGRQSRTVALHPEGHQRKPGRPGRGKSAARAVIIARAIRPDRIRPSRYRFRGMDRSVGARDSAPAPFIPAIEPHRGGSGPYAQTFRHTSRTALRASRRGVPGGRDPGNGRISGEPPPPGKPDRCFGDSDGQPGQNRRRLSPMP
ncbi:MAG: hypothetical protein IH985_09195 [Planctomycetes bacterium]|nr:hypothetical protein [Planctomycetota bacterium]